MKEKEEIFEKHYSPLRYIISNIAIIGYSENDIIERKNNINKKLKLTCLYSYPEFDKSSYNDMTYNMMFPDGNHTIECPKFFSLYLTNEKGNHSFLYCLKFSTKFELDDNDNQKNNNSLEINVPIVICIKSQKRDLDSFRKLLISINKIIINDNIDSYLNVVNNYKKVELMNLLYFLFSLPNMPPHSLVTLKLNNSLCEIEDEINFYFSSNCEIPCNNNDTDIDILFKILDQTIIIKVLIALLTEKQIVLVSSQAYLLHIIIPTLLQLIFPFKWDKTCITILSKDQLHYLENPLPFIFGVLSSSIQIQEIIKNNSGIIIIDCDTNEIYGENEPYNLQLEDKSYKSNNTIFTVSDCFIYQCVLDHSKKQKEKHKLRFVEKNDIIISTRNSQLLINKFHTFISSEELKWLRKNIQLVKNPEIFDVENINKHKNKDIIKNNIFDENESPILLNRTFSYNIQNILMHFYLKKITDINSEFMNSFKKMNLYLTFNYVKKYKFQNNSNFRIIENILETKLNQRNISNCFKVEYNISQFSASSVIDTLNKKLNEINNIFNSKENNIMNEKEKNEKINKYKYLKSVLMDYCLALGINNHQAKNDTFNIEDSIELTPFNSKNKLNISQHKKIHGKYGHAKSKKILQLSSNQNLSLSLEGIDESSKKYFKFYGKDGLFYFLNNIESFIKEEGKKLDNIIYKNKIYNQLINIYKNYKDIFGFKKKDNEIINVNMSVLDIKNKTNNLDQIDIDIEDLNNENDFNKPMLLKKNESLTERNAKKPLTYELFNEKLGNNSLKKKTVDTDEKDENEKEEKLDEIIVFTNFDDKKEKDNTDFINNIYFCKNANNNNNNNKKLSDCQYFLLLAFYLEEIKSDNKFLEKFNKDIYKTSGKKNIINYLILKLYKVAYLYSGHHHRDFPYFSFYSFLLNLEGDKFLKFYNYINKERYRDLYDIYMYIVKTKKYYLENYNKDFSKTITVNILNIFNTFKPNNNSKTAYLEYDMIYNICTLLTKCFPTKDDIKSKSITDIINEVNSKIKTKNPNIMDYIYKLKLINLNSFPDKKKRCFFWLNCFNFLITFSVFFLKITVPCEQKIIFWKNFLHNVKYNIGQNDFSFEDMLYILFQRNVFFPNEDYKPPEHVKQNIVDLSEIKNNNESIIISPFLLYLPTTEFFRPIIYFYNDVDFEDYITKGLVNYFSYFLKWDKSTNTLTFHELILFLEPTFIGEGIQKYKNYIDEKLYKMIKNGKYTLVTIPMKYELSFTNLIKDAYIYS